MARKRIAVRPIEPLELEFADGTVKEAKFDVEMMMILSDEFGDLTELAKEGQKKPYDLAAKLLYCGLKVFDKDVTLNEAKTIVVGGGLPLLQAIFESVVETFNGIDDEEFKKKVLQELQKLQQT